MSLVAKFQSLLETLLAQADDPEERIRKLVADLRRRQGEGRRALGMAIALEKRLLDDVVAAEDEVTAWESAAKEALAKSDEPAAQDAAARALPAKARLDERRKRHEEQKEVAAKVRSAVLEAARRTDEVARAKSVLLARARCAEAMQSIAQSLQIIASPEVKVVEERMRAAVEKKEAAAQV
jgi:phage shock protein A